MPSANLKKLAVAGKITPATQVRMGESGTWVSASKVQGLFAAPRAQPPTGQGTSSQRMVVSPPAPSSNDEPPRVVEPPPPPTAAPLAPSLHAMASPPVASNGMAPPPWAKPAAPPVAHGSGASAKILGALAMIFAAVAVATCWLPMLGGVLGFAAIAFGGLGLVIGVAGLVAATMTNSSTGLILNIIGGGGSAVGLVLTIVLGVTFGLFGGAPEPAPVVAALPVAPPVVQRPPPVVEPEPEPEPEPPPEPVWTGAAVPIQQGPIKASVAKVAIEQVRMESTDLSRITRPKPQPMLKIQVTLENTSNDKIIEAPGWMGGGDLIGQGVGQLLGGATGEAVPVATATLTDSAGNNYKQAHSLSLFGAQLDFGADHALRPGNSKAVELVFPPPLDSIEYLRLELSANGFGGTDPLRFQIPRAMINGMPAIAGG
jgi:hypothetical protein